MTIVFGDIWAPVEIYWTKAIVSLTVSIVEHVVQHTDTVCV